MRCQASSVAMALHQNEVISGQTHRLGASVYQPRSGDISVSLHESSIRAKSKILGTAHQINLSRASYESTLSETLSDRKSHVEKSQSIVDAMYLRYLELSRCTASQVQLMNVNGKLHCSSGLSDVTNCNSSISGAPQKHLIILPEHFSRRDFPQKVHNCRVCGTLSTQTSRGSIQPVSIKKKHRSCRCLVDLDGRNRVFTLPTSPWEGSQYKLTLVVSLRAKVLLKVIFSAFAHNAAIGNHCRRAVTLCCETKLRRLMRCCFLAIQFEGLSTRYIAICSEQNAYKLICAKYLKPALDRLRFNVVVRNLYVATFDAAKRHRSKRQLRSGFGALWLNKSGRRSLGVKKRWAALYSMNKILSRALMAWCTAAEQQKNCTKDELFFISGCSEEKRSDHGECCLVTDVSFDEDSLSSSISMFQVSITDKAKNLSESDHNDEEGLPASRDLGVQDPLFADFGHSFSNAYEAVNITDDTQQNDLMLLYSGKQSLSVQPVAVQVARILARSSHQRDPVTRNADNRQTKHFDVELNAVVPTSNLEIPSPSGSIKRDQSSHASADISPQSSRSEVRSSDVLGQKGDEGEGVEVVLEEEEGGGQDSSVDGSRQHNENHLEGDEEKEVEIAHASSSSAYSSSSTGTRTESDSGSRTRRSSSRNVTLMYSDALFSPSTVKKRKSHDVITSVTVSTALTRSPKLSLSSRRNSKIGVLRKTLKRSSEHVTNVPHIGDAILCRDNLEDARCDVAMKLYESTTPIEHEQQQQQQHQQQQQQQQQQTRSHSPTLILPILPPSLRASPHDTSVIPKGRRLESVKVKGTPDIMSLKYDVDNHLKSHCLIEELRYLNSSESGVDADITDDDVDDDDDDEEALSVPEYMQLPVDPFFLRCTESSHVSADISPQSSRSEARSPDALGHRGDEGGGVEVVLEEEEEGENVEENEEDVDSDKRYGQSEGKQELVEEEVEVESVSSTSTSTGSESYWSCAFTDEKRNKGTQDINKPGRNVSSDVPCDIISSQLLPVHSTSNKVPSYTNAVIQGQTEQQVQKQGRIEKERYAYIENQKQRERERSSNDYHSEPDVKCLINNSLRIYENVRVPSKNQNDFQGIEGIPSIKSSRAQSDVKGKHWKRKINKKNDNYFSPTAACEVDGVVTMTELADWGHLPVGSRGKSLLDDSDLESFASLKGKGSSMTYEPVVSRVFSSSTSSSTSKDSDVCFQGSAIMRDTVRAYEASVIHGFFGPRSPDSLTQSSCDRSVCTPDSFIGYTAATLQGALTPTPAGQRTGMGSGQGVGVGSGTEQGTGYTIQRALDVTISTPFKMLRTQLTLRHVMSLSRGVPLEDIEAMIDLEAEAKNLNLSSPTKESSTNSVMTSPDVSKNVLEALIIIRRCRRYFQKLRSTVRISRAYRILRRTHRVRIVKGCLTSWHDVTLIKQAKGRIAEKLAITRACRRALRAWVKCSLVQPNVLMKAVKKVLEENRMKYAMSRWCTVMNRRKRENAKDDNLERLARVVHLNDMKRTKEHSWSAWLMSRSFLRKEIQVVKMTQSSIIKAMFHLWQMSMNIMKRSDEVEVKYRLSSCKTAMMAWKNKVTSRSMMRKIFCDHSKLQNNRLMKTSTPFRLLSSILQAWREITVEILAIKREIRTLKLEKQRILLLQFEEEKNARQRRKDERWDRVSEQVQMEVARTYRDATLKAEVFCTWAEWVANKKKQREIVQSYVSQKQYNTVLNIFKEWFAISIIEKEKKEKTELKILARSEIKQKKVFFSVLQNLVEKKYSNAMTFYRSNTLRYYWHVLRVQRTVQILEKNFGPLFGARKVYLQRTLKCWIRVFRLKRKMTYAVQLLQVTMDRAKAREALLKWPGWQEYRKSEVMRKQILLKRGIGQNEIQEEGEGEGEREGVEEMKGQGIDHKDERSQYNLVNKSYNQQHNQRIKSKDKLIKNEQNNQTSTRHPLSQTNKHSPLPPSLPFPQLFSLPRSLSLAERLAVVVGDMRFDGIQASYASALSSARNILDVRTSILSSRSFYPPKLHGNLFAYNDSYCDYPSCSDDNISTNGNNNSSSSSSCSSNSSSSDSVDRRGRGSINRDGNDHLGYFVKSLRDTHSSSAEDRAVKELLLLLQIVLLAWKKTTNISSDMRTKIRRIRHMVKKRAVARVLRQWISRTSTVSYREVCWIKPAIQS